SFPTRRSSDLLAGFLAGQGFADPVLSSLVVNSKGQTLNDLLDIITEDAALFEDSYALHFKYNMNYQIAEISAVPVMHSRFGIPDDDGDVFDIKINNNWERNPYKSSNHRWTIYEYPVFNPDPEVVRQQIEFYGVNNFPGQILFKTNKPGVYPDATFDAVIDQAQTQAEIGVFGLAAVQNGFTATTLFKYPGTFEDKDDEEEFKRELNNFKGPRGANSTMVVENPSGNFDQGNLIESLQLPNMDREHENTEKVSKHSIREAFSMPAEILGVLPENGMFNRENIEQAFTYYNDITQLNRDRIS